MNIAVPAFDLHAVPHGKKIYLYGASIWGRIAYTALKAAGIQASAFIDQHISQAKDLPVIRIDEVEAIEDAVFLICAAQCFGDIHQELQQRGAKYIYSIENLIAQCPYALLEKNFDVEEKTFDQTRYLFYKDIYTKEVFARGYTLPELGIIPQFTCNLKCEKCANFNTILTEKPYYSFETIKNNLNILLQLFTIEKITLCGGGEFFCYKEWRNLLRYVLALPVRHIDIITNATILPQEMDIPLLQEQKIRILLDDYRDTIGTRSKISQWLELASQYHIDVAVHKYAFWNDFTDISFRNDTPAVLTKRFSQCTISHCFALCGTDFVRCVRAYLWEKGFIKRERERERESPSHIGLIRPMRTIFL